MSIFRIVTCSVCSLLPCFLYNLLAYILSKYRLCVLSWTPVTMEDFVHSPSSTDITKKMKNNVIIDREILSQLMAVLGNCKQVLSGVSLTCGYCILH